MLAVASLEPLFTIVALVAFGCAVWLVVAGRYLAALVAAVVAVLILLYA